MLIVKAGESLIEPLMINLSCLLGRVVQAVAESVRVLVAIEAAILWLLIFREIFQKGSVDFKVMILVGHLEVLVEMVVVPVVFSSWDVWLAVLVLVLIMILLMAFVGVGMEASVVEIYHASTTRVEVWLPSSCS